MIPRFETISELTPELLRAHLQVNGAVLIEKFLWEPLAKLDREDLLWGDERKVDFALQSRIENSHALMNLVADSIDGNDQTECIIDLLTIPPGNPGDERTDVTVGSVLCLLFLDTHDHWTSAPVIGGETINVPRGSVLIFRGDIEVGLRPNIDPESRVMIGFRIDPPTPPP